MVSWLAPANVGEGGLLVPALGLWVARWSWRPDYIVADMGCLAAANKQICRQRWQVAVLTHLRSDMKVIPPFETERQALCPQGAPLRWLGYDARLQEHWFGAAPEAGLCERCWQQSQCLRQFVYPASAHETLLGRLPLNTRAAQFLLQKIRPWIEPAQSHEKNQLGLGGLFLTACGWRGAGDCWPMRCVCCAPVRSGRCRPMCIRCKNSCPNN